jgi:hypothetical protein
MAYTLAKNMNMTFRVSLGDQERTITPDELTRFEALLQLDRIARGRCSRLLIAELLLWNEIYGHEPFQIARQIEALENRSKFSGTKDETEFRHEPLKGLWHKHFFDAHFIAPNLLNEWGGDRLNKLIKEVCDPKKSEVFTEEMANELTHRLVHGAMESRDQEERLTGEWIIFDKEDGTNYYLCLARHSDGDEAIFAKLRAIVFPEFPHLQTKYG